MPVSKKMPTSEDLPPQARPILLKLMGAYYEWYLQEKNPERPKTITLRGTLNEDGTLPEFPLPTVLVGEIVSRAAIRDFISDMGRKSAYDFSLIEQKKPFVPVEAGAEKVIARQVRLEQADTQPHAVFMVEVPASEKTEQRRAPQFTMKKAALIEQHKDEWPTVERDIVDAKRNGLSAAAKAGDREWREADAIEWARTKGKLKSTEKPANLLAGAMHKMSTLPARLHKLEG